MLLGGASREGTHRVARVVDTRLEGSAENHVTFVVEEGAAVASYTPLVSSSHSTQNTVFNLNNIADRTCRDSRLALGMTLTVTLNVTNTDGVNPHTVINADNFGLKQYPLNRAINSVQHSINQASYTMRSNQILSEIARVNALPMDSDFFENTQPDMIDSYAKASGSNLTPIGPYTNTLLGDGVFKPRSLGYTVTGNTIAAGATAAVTITVPLYEPLITPFCNISSKNRRGLYAITGEIVNIQWVSDLFNNMFAFDAPTNITLNSATVGVGANATLYTIYLTPQEGYFPEIPRESVYPYNDYSIFSNDIGPCNAGATLAGVTSQVVNFTNIPQKILVYARLSNNARTSSTPDKYLKISRVNAVFDNGLPQLSNATTDQLYDVSKRNGLQMPRAAFAQRCLNEALVAASGAQPLYGCGSVLALDPALDLGLRYESASGSAGRYIFQVTLDLTNETDLNFSAVTLFVVGINSAVLERVGTEYRNYLISLPVDVLAEAKALAPVDHQTYMDAKHSNAFLSGGGIGDWFKKAYQGIKKAAKWGLKHQDDIGKAIDVGQKLYQDVAGEPKKNDGGRRSLASSVRPARKRDLFYE